MGNNITSFFGESLSDVVFARKTELEENIDNWYAYLFNVVEKERKELFYKMLENDGKIYPKDLVGFRSKFSDALGWLWINVFLAGDKSLADNVSFSDVNENVVEFAEKSLAKTNVYVWLDKYADMIDEYQENKKNKKLLLQIQEEYKRYQQVKDKLRRDLISAQKEFIQKGKLDRSASNNLTELEALEQTIKSIDEEYGLITGDIKRNKLLSTKLDREATRSAKTPKSKQTKTLTEEQLQEEAKKRNVNLEDAKRLKEITQRQRSDATGFINDTDFGRVYVQQRRDYIAQVYTNKTEKENMLSVFNQMNKQYEEGDASPPIQKYFERRYMRKEKVTGNVTIGNEDLKTDSPVNIGGVTLAGKRSSPNPVKKNDPLRELKLYEDVRKNMGGKISDGRLRNIVKTEVVAAYNMGRLHQMYTNNTKFVRWVNDVENRTEGKVCQICTIRAMGTSESLRKFAGKESLSGIYTIEDAFTNRQLAIPSHVNCLCQLRPISDMEEKVLIAAGVFKTDMVNTASVVASIAGATVEGLNNTQLATEGTDRSGWWYGTLAAGGAAVAIGAMMFYMRKSLTTKYTGTLMRKKGVSIAENINQKTIRPFQPVTQKQLDESLKITEDITQDLGDTIKTPKYSKQQLERFPELKIPLVDLSTLKRTANDTGEAVQREVEDLLISHNIDNFLIDEAKNAINIPDVPKNTLRLNLQDRKEELIERLTNINQTYVDDPVTRPFMARMIIENEKSQRVVADLLDQLDKVRDVGAGVTRDEVRNIFDDIGSFDVNLDNLQMGIGGESFKTKTKSMKIDFNNRFSEGGVIDSDIMRLSKLARKLNASETITLTDFRKIRNQLRKIEKERAITELGLTNRGYNVFNQVENFIDVVGEDIVTPNTLRIYRKNKQHNLLIKEVSQKLEELKTSTPTYKQKLEAGEITDRFVGEIKTSQSSTSVKNLALKKRTQSISTLEEYIKLAGKKDMQPSTAESVANRLLDIVEKVEPASVEDFVEKFVNSNAKERVKILRKYRDMLIGETRRIRDAEFKQASFTRFQQKWAMFGSPR